MAKSAIEIWVTVANKHRKALDDIFDLKDDHPAIKDLANETGLSVEKAKEGVKAWFAQNAGRI